MMIVGLSSIKGCKVKFAIFQVPLGQMKNEFYVMINLAASARILMMMNGE